jgi:hypothetical protein
MGQLAYATGQSWYVVQRKPHGGFCFIHANSISAAWAELVSGRMELRDFRAWLGCHELVARRCTLAEGRQPAYSADELGQLIGATATEHVRASLRRLERLGLVSFAESSIDTTPSAVSVGRGRPIPIPRPVLRMLAKSRGRAFIATVLGHLMRCLYYRKGQCRSGGWCKASWIADTFGVAVRAVKEARRRLVALGLLRLLRADQNRLNRFGRPLVVELTWAGESAPRKRDSTSESAPPYTHKELSYRRDDHQKPAQASGAAGARIRAREPNLNDVTVADLEDPWRLAALFKQARKRGWVRRCRADILAVYSAAAHAMRVATRSAPGLFYWTLSNSAWSYVTCHDEDEGQRMLARLRTL